MFLNSKHGTRNPKLLNSRPAMTLIRSPRCIEHLLHAVTIFEVGGTFHVLAPFFDRRDEGAGKDGEAPRPTSFTHPGSELFLINLHSSPGAGSCRRVPKFTGLLNH